MTESEKKQLLKFQQGELDAVALYKKLAENMKTEESKKLLLSVAADEGKHAAILREYTGETLKPSYKKANLMDFLYRRMSKKLTFLILESGEKLSVYPYRKIEGRYSKITGIIADELRHSKIAARLAKL